MDQLRRDLHYAVRMLFRNKTWAVLAIVTLALGIGPLTALYSYFDRVFFAKLPVPDPDDVVAFREVRHVDGRFPHPTQISNFVTDIRGFEQMRDVNQTLTELFAFEPIARPVDTIANDAAGKARIQFVSGNYFSALKLSPIRGRMFLPDEDNPSAPPVAVISEPYWERVFGRDRNAIGEFIMVD